MDDGNCGGGYITNLNYKNYFKNKIKVNFLKIIIIIIKLIRFY
jgi:hypothetical protein